MVVEKWVVWEGEPGSRLRVGGPWWYYVVFHKTNSIVLIIEQK